MTTEINKKEFIELLADGSIPAKNSQNMLDNISPVDFTEFNDERYPIKSNKSMWNEDYFRAELSLIQHKEFSKQRCEHLIAVKKYLQDIKVVGFGIADEQHTSAVNETLHEILENSDEAQEIDISLISEKPDAEISEDILRGYEPKESLQQAIAEKNIKATQNVIKFDLKNNRLLIEDIIQEVMFVRKNVPEAFLEYKEDNFCLAIDKNSDSWNKDYFLLQQSYLNHNFALERIMHLINVRNSLAKEGVEGFENIKAQPKAKSQYNYSSSSSNTSQSAHGKQENSFIKTAIIIGGAVLAGILALITLTR